MVSIEISEYKFVWPTWKINGVVVHNNVGLYTQMSLYGADIFSIAYKYLNLYWTLPLTRSKNYISDLLKGQQFKLGSISLSHHPHFTLEVSREIYGGHPLEYLEYVVGELKTWDPAQMKSPLTQEEIRSAIQKQWTK